MSKYLGESLLAIWPDRSGTHGAVARALSELAVVQKEIAQTRIALHYGSVLVGGTALCGSGVVSGPSVSFLYRMDRLGETLKATVLISEAAGSLLAEELTLIECGHYALSGFEGEFRFLRI